MPESLPETPTNQTHETSLSGAAQGTAMMTGVSLLAAVLGYFLNVALGWLLPVTQYGNYSVFFAVQGIIALSVTTAFPWAAAKFIAADTNPHQQYGAFCTALAGNIGTAIIISAILYFSYTALPFGAEIDKNWVLLLITLLIFTALFAMLTGTLQGLFRFGQMGVVQLILAVTRVTASIILVQLGFGAAGAISGIIVATVVSSALTLYFLRRFRFWQTRKWTEQRIFTFAPAMFLAALGMTLLANTDLLGVKFISQSAVSSELAGYYQSAHILARIPLLVTGAMMMAMFPFISKHTGTDNRRYSLTSLWYAVLFILPVSLALIIIPEKLIVLLYPQNYAAGADALRVVTPGIACLSIATIMSYTFQALGKPWIPALTLLVAAAAQLVALVLLIPMWGLIGAATATTTASFLGVCYLSTKYIGIYRPLITPIPVLKLTAALATPGFLLFFLVPDGKVWTIAGLLVAVVMYAVLLILLGLVSERDLDIVAAALPQSKAVRILVSKTRQVIIGINSALRS